MKKWMLFGLSLIALSASLLLSACQPKEETGTTEGTSTTTPATGSESGGAAPSAPATGSESSGAAPSEPATGSESGGNSGGNSGGQ